MPVIAKMALQTAGRIGGSAGSPRPVGLLSDRTKCTSISFGACDILTSVGYEALAKMQKGKTRALVNTALVMPASFTREPDLRFPLEHHGSVRRLMMRVEFRSKSPRTEKRIVHHSPPLPP